MISCLRSSFLALTLLLVASLPQTQAGALDDYLANPPEIANPPWQPTAAPHRAIPFYQKKFLEGATENDRAVAIGCLAFTAQSMGRVPETQAAANELLAQWVVPNLALTRQLDRTNAFAWKGSILTTYNAYKFLGNQEAATQCLEDMRVHSTNRNDQEMAVYLMAFDHAKNERYDQAIATINTLPDDSKWTAQRKRLNIIWKKKQNGEEFPKIKKNLRPRRTKKQNPSPNP